MKKTIMFSLIVTGIIAGLAFSPDKKNAGVEKNNTTGDTFKPVALIELFTSQGCSSCPSADRLLGQTISAAKKDNKNVIAISFHVDYWNRLGWSDPFSEKAYSERQRQYAAALNLDGVYTPQMIVNGNNEFVGSDEDKLKMALEKSLNATPVAGFTMLTASVKNGAAPTVKFALDGNYSGCKINFALVSLSETTSIKRGENSGVTLTNDNIVRQFVSIPATANGEVNFKNSPVPTGTNLAVVAYIQHNSDLKIIGAAKAELN